jgi:hypothetical protein
MRCRSYVPVADIGPGDSSGDSMWRCTAPHGTRDEAFKARGEANTTESVCGLACARVRQSRSKLLQSQVSVFLVKRSRRRRDNESLSTRPGDHVLHCSPRFSTTSRMFGIFGFGFGTRSATRQVKMSPIRSLLLNPSFSSHFQFAQSLIPTSY